MIRYSLKRFSALYSESSSTFALTWCFHKCYFSNSTLKCDSFFAQLSSLGYTDKSIQDGIRNALSLSFGGAVNDSHLKMLGNEGVWIMQSRISFIIFKARRIMFLLTLVSTHIKYRNTCPCKVCREKYGE